MRHVTYLSSVTLMALSMILSAVAGVQTANGASVAKTTRDTLNVSFDPGTGNPNTDFAITRVTENNGNTIEIGVKGKRRFVGQSGVGGSGTLYTVQPGLSPTSATNSTPDPDRAWWNFDFSINLGDRDLLDTDVALTIVDPESDSLIWDFNQAASDDNQTLSDISLIQSSWNIGFEFINTGTFTPTNTTGMGGLNGFQPYLTGDYDITFEVSDSSGLIGSQSITARVVPTPSAALGGLMLLGAMALRRRRRAA